MIESSIRVLGGDQWPLGQGRGDDGELVIEASIGDKGELWDGASIRRLAVREGKGH